MANQEHLDILHQGSQAWNRWRYNSPDIHPDLSAASLKGFDPIMPGFDDTEALLGSLSLNLSKVNLRDADLEGAKLWGANLSQTILVETNFAGATLSHSKVYGIAAWNVKLSESIQNDIVITRSNEPVITVDDLEVAQFLYLRMKFLIPDFIINRCHGIILQSTSLIYQRNKPFGFLGVISKYILILLFEISIERRNDNQNKIHRHYQRYTNMIGLWVIHRRF